MLKITGKQTLELAQEPRVSKEGMRELGVLFHAYTGHSMPDIVGDLYDDRIEDYAVMIDTPVGQKPVRYNGKIAKRLAQCAHKRFGIKLTQEQVCTLGTIAGNHKITSQSVIYDITGHFDWHSGDFGDHGSCYWGDRSAARPAMEAAGFMALRFYGEDGHGIGRCWIAPQGKDTFVLFNAYASRNTWLNQNGSTLRAMATILCEQYGFSQSKCGLNNYGTDTGTLWINGGRGIVLYTGDCPGDYFDLEVECDDGEICGRCGHYCDEDYTFWVESESRWICEDCYNEHYGYCSACEETYPYDNLTYVEDAEEYLCEFCFSEDYTYCENCDEITRKDETYGGECLECLECASGRIGVCDNCGETYDTSDGKIPEVCKAEIGWHRDTCNGVVKIHCAHCHKQVYVGDCYTDPEGIHYCKDCRGFMVVKCAVCGKIQNQSYMHSVGQKHYCPECQPSIFAFIPGLTIYRIHTRGVWNHAG